MADNSEFAFGCDSGAGTKTIQIALRFSALTRGLSFVPLMLWSARRKNRKERVRSNLKRKSVWSTVVALKPQGHPVDRNAPIALDGNLRN
jgi:hypothetical protein